MGRGMHPIKKFATDAAQFAIKRTIVGAFLSPNKHRRRLLYSSFYGSKMLLCAGLRNETFVVSTDDLVIGREIFAFGEFEFERFDLVASLLKKKGRGMPTALIDVGANVGPICIPAVVRGYVKRAVAVEPEPTNCRLLRANIALNGVHDLITVEEFALAESGGLNLDFELSDVNLGDHRVKVIKTAGKYREQGRRVIQVKSKTLDAVCTPLAKENLLIWIDTQGYEGFVLAGGQQALRRREPLVLEFWPYGMDRAGSFALLKASLTDYSGFYDLREKVSFNSIDRLDELYASIGSGGDYTDILVL